MFPRPAHFSGFLSPDYHTLEDTAQEMVPTLAPGISLGPSALPSCGSSSELPGSLPDFWSRDSCSPILSAPQFGHAQCSSLPWYPKDSRQGDQGGDLSRWQMTCTGPVLPPWGHFLPVGNGSGQLPQFFWKRCPLTSFVSLDTIRSARRAELTLKMATLGYTGNGKSSR